MKAILINLTWRLGGALLGLLIGSGIGFWLGEPLVRALDLSPFAWMSVFVARVVMLPLLALSGAILGAIMIYLRRQWNWAIGLLLSLALGGSLAIHQLQLWAAQPTVEPLGNFARLTYPDQEWGPYDELHYRGERLSFPDPMHQFGISLGVYSQINALITFTLPSAVTAPVFVVNVGDMAHETLFFLVREVDGQATVDFLCRADGKVTATWVDSPLAAVTVPPNAALGRVKLAGQGRWLLLNEYCLFDVETLRGFDKRYNFE
ncbi:MAG: hypothetical protein R3C14_50985 [Caldilineaceae bacterium]